MVSLLAWMAPVVLALPLAAPVADPRPHSLAEHPLAETAGNLPEQDREAMSRPADTSGPISSPLDWSDVIAYFTFSFRSETVEQMRFEERIIIRIPRRPQATGTSSLASPPNAPRPRNYEERRIGRCLPMAEIAGVQVLQNERLLLYMRDQRIISAQLERACNARDFYLGFYLERSEDGRLCTDRDDLHARSGATCELEQLYQLVPTGD